MAEELVIPNVYAIVRDRDAPRRIVLQKRWKPESDPANTGRWELPGGKWRAFEPLVECARREIEEECGLTDVEVLAPGSRHRLRDDEVEVTAGMRLVQMLAGPYPSVLAVVDAVATGEPLPVGDGSRDAAWMHEDEILRRMDGEPDSFTALSYAALREALVH